jgi:hypothetical protein
LLGPLWQSITRANERAETALQHAQQRASVEQRSAAQASRRPGEVEVQLAQEVVNRDTLAQNLADAQAALNEAERRHASQMTTVAAHLAGRQAQYERNRGCG